MRAAAIAIICSWILIVPSQARAATESILVYGPEDAGMSELQRATTLLQANVGEDEVPSSTVHILDLPFPSPDPVWIAGDARVVPCSDPALEESDLARLLAEAVEKIDALDYEAGRRVLDQAIIALPCSQQQVDRQVLIDIYYFRGIASFNMGDRDAAKQNFFFSLAIDKDKKWDTNYPPDPQQVFLLAKDDAMSLDRVEIGHDVRNSGTSRFGIDGVARDVDEVGVLRVIPGMHLVQYVTEGTAYSRLVEVRQDGPTALVTRQGLTAAVSGGPETMGMLPAARASLRSLVQSRNLKRAYVVILDEAGHGNLYRYDETFTTMALEAGTDGGTGTASTGDGGSRPAGGGTRVPIETGDSGGGITLHPAGVAFAHWDGYFSFSLRGHIRLYQGLEIDIGGGLGLAEWWDDDEETGGVVVLPNIRAGVRYRFGNKIVRPYVGASFLLNFWLDSWMEEGDLVEEVTASPGIGGFGGVEVHLTKSLYLGVDVLAGWAGAPWIMGQFGVGLRF